MSDNALLRRLAQVQPQTKAIRDLDRVRRRGADGLGVGAGPVAAHDLGPGVLWSHAVKVSAVRSGSTSTGRPVSMSISTVP
ncbi:hypothetical protein ABIA38_008266 [Embleya sp. AB8]